MVKDSRVRSWIARHAWLYLAGVIVGAFVMNIVMILGGVILLNKIESEMHATYKAESRARWYNVVFSLNVALRAYRSENVAFPCVGVDRWDVLDEHLAYFGPRGGYRKQLAPVYGEKVSSFLYDTSHCSPEFLQSDLNGGIWYWRPWNWDRILVITPGDSADTQYVITYDSFRHHVIYLRKSPDLPQLKAYLGKPLLDLLVQQQGVVVRSVPSHDADDGRELKEYYKPYGSGRIRGGSGLDIVY